MRCLRAIGEAQHTGHVYLSEDNMAILEDELQQNFRVTVQSLQASGTAIRSCQNPCAYAGRESTADQSTKPLPTSGEETLFQREPEIEKPRPISTASCMKNARA